MRSGTLPRPPADAGHIAALDGIRALAIFAVMCTHAGGLFPPTRGGIAVMHVFGYGWAGVDLFFVLSGMLITGILLDTKGAPGYYRSFYARRTLRIFPLYYVALFVLVLAPAVHGWITRGVPVNAAGHVGLWTYTSNIQMVLSESSRPMTNYTFPFWSLAVEEQFYLVWPLLVARLSRRALARTAAAMIVVAFLLRVCLVATGGHAVGLYVSTPTRMDALATGALVAIAARAPGGLTRYRPFVAPAFVASALGLVVLFALSGTNDHDAPLIATGGLSLFAVASAALLVGVLTAAPTSRLRRAFEAPWARHVGARSYGVYVWHVAIFSAARGGANALAAVVPGYVIHGLIAFSLACVAAVAVANLSWLVIEEPFLRLKRFVPRPPQRPWTPRSAREIVPADASTPAVPTPEPVRVSV